MKRIWEHSANAQALNHMIQGYARFGGEVREGLTNGTVTLESQVLPDFVQSP